MKIRARWKLWGRKPRHTPQQITASSGPTLSDGQQAALRQLVAVEEEGAGGDGDDPGGQAVEAVDQVDGVGDDADPRHRDQRLEVGRQRDEPGERDLEVEHRDAEQVQHAAGEHLSGHLGRRGHLPDVVEEPDAEDHGGPEHHARAARSSAGRRRGTGPSATRRPSRRGRRRTSPTPPAVGVARSWTLRSDSASITPHRTASLRVTNVSEKLAAADRPRMAR